MMKTSTQTSLLSARFGDEKAVEMIQKSGFDCIDYSFSELTSGHPFYGTGYREYYAGLRKQADRLGIRFNQSHAHFPTFKQDDEAFNAWVTPLLPRALEVTAILGGKVSVIHPHMSALMTGAEKFERNMNFFRGLQPYAERLGVKIGIENMFGREEKTGKILPDVCSHGDEYVRYLDTLQSDCFTACLDIGHGELQGAGDRTVQLIRALGGKRIGALHIHDNDRVSDLHTLPLLGRLNWDEIMGALKEADYSGDFTLECDGAMARYPDGLLETILLLAAKTTRWFVEHYQL